MLSLIDFPREVYGKSVEGQQHGLFSDSQRYEDRPSLLREQAMVLGHIR